jgi:hypothetical protein
MYIFLANPMLMGIYQMPTLKSYASKDFLLKTPVSQVYDPEQIQIA